MKKNIYRAKNVKDINVEKLAKCMNGRTITFGIDIAKEDMYGVFVGEKDEIIMTIKWKHPHENHLLMDLLQSCNGTEFVAAMEPSGSYGDSLRYQLRRAHIPVYRVSPKKSHDFTEIYDGVPSSHDAKSAAIVAHLHLYGRSDIWEEASEEAKALRAAISQMQLYDDFYYRQCNRLEALLARHWPEVTTILKLSTASLQELLMEFGSPQAVAASPGKARQLLKRVGGTFLDPEKIVQVIASAQTTIGLPPIDEERTMIVFLAREVRRASKKANKAKTRVETLSQEQPQTQVMTPIIGKVSSAIVYANVGKADSYSSSAAWIKAMGLNLKERSSGKFKGQLKITKRGPSLVRKYLHLAILRLIQENIYFKRWYERKVKRDGGKKMKALTALVRKLAKALWYVGQGYPFESHLLFDTNRLKIK